MAYSSASSCVSLGHHNAKNTTKMLIRLKFYLKKFLVPLKNGSVTELVM